MTAMRSSLRLCSFVTYLQDGSYLNTRMRDDSDAFEFEASYFVTYLQDGSYINTRMREDSDAFEFEALFFCNIFARWVLPQHTH